MTIHPLLQNSPLGGAEIKLVTVAYESCLRVLRLSDRSDPLNTQNVTL
jgi:hypothetical protein